MASNNIAPPLAGKTAKWFGVTLDGDAHDALFDARLCALLSEQLDREADGGF